MEKRLNELLSALPSSWTDIKAKDFMKLSAIPINEDGDVLGSAENTLNVIALLTDASVDELENFPMGMLAKLTARIEFLYHEPIIDKKSKINWKNVEEITYSDLDIFQQYFNGTFDNIHLIVKSFSKNELSEDNILEMNMQEVHTAFFFLRLVVQKFIKDTRNTLINQFQDKKVRRQLKQLFKTL